MKNQSAIVTGSTSGIGLAIAERLAKEGVRVLLNGFGNLAEIEKTRKSLEAIYHPADMRKPAEIRDMIATAEKHFGRVDILVNNAGIQFTSRVENFPDDKWDDILAINLSSAFHASKAVLPGMQQRKSGRIISVASVHGLVASKEKSAYVAAKHGIIGLTKVTALENAGGGITCNAICPGFVLTPLVQKQIDDRAAAQRMSQGDAARALLAEKQPALDFVKPEEIAGMVVYLSSPAARMITGAAFTMDGGWTAQ